MIEEMQVEQAHQGIDAALRVVKEERQRQIAKWGVQEHTPEFWYARLGEEFGEVGQEIAEGDGIKAFDLAKYVEELSHLAAVATAMIQCVNDGIA